MAHWPVAWKRRLGLLGFCAFCLLPTASVLAWALAWRLPNHLHDVSAELSCALGCKVTATAVRHLRPNVYQLQDVVFTEPLTNSHVARCDRLFVSWQSHTATGAEPAASLGRSLLLSCEQLQVDATRRRLFARLVRNGTEYSLGDTVNWVRLKANRVLLRTDRSVYELTGLTADVRRRASETDTQVQFFATQFPTPEPIQVRFGRNSSSDPPPAGFGVYTGNGAVPSSFLSLLLPGIERLGPRSTLHGYVWLFDAPDGRAGEVVGRFDQVDLQSLAGSWPNPTLQGTVSLRLDVVRFRSGRIAEAAGTIQGEAGALNGRLLQAMSSGLGATIVSGPQAGPEWIPYDVLAAEFRLDSKGLILRGRCSGGSVGTLLLGPQGLVVREPAVQPVPIAALAHVLAQSNALQVPGTREVVDLLRWLPLPQQAGPPRSGGQQPVPDSQVARQPQPPGR